MAFKPSPRGYRTMMGVTPAQAVAALLDAGADVVGANCEITAEEMVGLVAELRAATDAPLVIQPNAGQPQLVEGHTVYGETPERFASFMPAIVAAGAEHRGGLLRHDARVHRGAARVGAASTARTRRRRAPRVTLCRAAPTVSKMRRTACSAVISMGS